MKFTLTVAMLMLANLAYADAPITPKHIENLQVQSQHLKLMIEAGKKSKQFNADDLKQLNSKAAEAADSLKEAQSDGQVSEPEYRQVRDLLAELKTLLYTLGKNPGAAPEMVAPLSPYSGR